jgi:alkaline phosphatase D
MKTRDLRWYDLTPQQLTRRDFLRVGRDAAACIALASLPGSHGIRLPRARALPFPYGVASGDPIDTGVVLWTRLDPAVARGAAVAVDWEIADSESFTRIVQKGSTSAPQELGYTVHAEVGGLAPGRDYWYRFHVAGETSAVGRTRTAPATGAALDRFFFAFVSCQNYEHGYFTAFRHIAEEHPELVVHLGDYIYERRFGNTPVREHEFGEVITLEQYRARYATYRLDGDLQAAHAACAWIVTPDDHEVQNNYADAVSETNAPREQFLLRRAAAYQAYYEFMPLRRASIPHGPGMQLYRRARFGDLLTFHVLDTRQFRSDQACGDGTKPRCAEALDTSRTMMGAAQEAWLAEGLRESRTRWNVLANQVMLAQVAGGPADAPTYSMDQWSGYPVARQRLIDQLGALRSANPIVITGDIHSNWVADLKKDFDNPASATVGVEFVGTSITSGGDGSDTSRASTFTRNPHIKFYNGRRGYVRATVTKGAWTSDYRTVPFVTRPDAPIETKGTFVVHDATMGVQQT